MVTLVAISALAAGILGFATQRASICTVKAVAEVLTTGRAHMLVSFAKTVLWVIAVSVPLGALWPEAKPAGPEWRLTWTAIGGGLVFGVGAAINRGCAFSTLTQLGSGRLRMVLTLFGFGLGIAAFAELASNAIVPPPQPGAPADAWFVGAGFALILGLWCLWEGWRLWHGRHRDTGVWALITAHRYRLSTGAALIGITNGFLYAVYGSWSYTGTLRRQIETTWNPSPPPTVAYWALAGALLIGMLVSSCQRGVFHLDWRPRLAWLENLAGGLLMGLGVGAIPGGNDVLLLHAIPGLSPNALPAYGAILAGIAATLMVRPAVTGRTPRIDCSGDICASD